MTFTFGDLIDDADWVPMDLDQQNAPSYFWNDGGLLADAPVSFAKTFREEMFVTTKPIDFPRFNRNPLRVRPNFVVPRHHHNVDETLFVFQGEYSIEYDEGDGRETIVVRAGDVFISRAGTAYTMTAGPEGVTYIETWPRPVAELETYWHNEGWVAR
jgi:mannose-6-phosphate isomerase-like protein (cupin superfamily)